MKAIYGAATVIMLTGMLGAQANSPGTNATKGSCSPAVSGNSNTFTINCQGLTREQSQEFLALLRKLTSNSLDSKVVMAKLDELIANTSDLKMDVKEIRREQVGRRPSDELMKSLSLRIRGMKQKVPIVIELVNGTAESTAFAERIVDIFNSADWKVVISPSMGFGQGVLKGQEMKVKSGDNPVAGELQEIFKEGGIEFSGRLQNSVPDNEVHIVIFGIP